MWMKILPLCGLLLILGLGPLHAEQVREKIFLINGLFGTGILLDRLGDRLQAEGYQVERINLDPADGTQPIEILASRLQRRIEAECDPGESFSLVAFSMGGLVARHYLMTRRPVGCQTFIALSVPHHGSYLARISDLIPLAGIREMRPGSDFLQQMRAEQRLSGTRYFNYQTPYDLMVAPSSFQEWREAEKRMFPVPLHSMMLLDPAVAESILCDLQGKRPTARESRARAWAARR